MKKMYNATKKQNALILLACLVSTFAIITVNGYIRHQEQTREARFLGNKFTQKGTIAIYFIKGIHPSY